MKKCRKIALGGQCYVKEEKNIFSKYRTNGSLVDSVMRKEEKLSPICIQKHCSCRVLVQERRNYMLSLDFVFKQVLAVEFWCEKGKLFYSQLNNLRFPFPIWRRKKKSLRNVIQITLFCPDME